MSYFLFHKLYDFLLVDENGSTELTFAEEPPIVLSKVHLSPPPHTHTYTLPLRLGQAIPTMEMMMMN